MKIRIPESVQRFLRKFAVSNLMTYLVIGMATVYVLDLVLPINLTGMLSLLRSRVFLGEIWRLLTFTVIPPASGMIWIVLTLYLYWMIGTVLENQWGTHKFNLFYWFGVIGVIIAAMISGYGSSYYLNMSLYLAFAALNPDFELLLFFILPVKMKYLGLIDAVYFVYRFFAGGLNEKLLIGFAFLNLFLFLGGDFINTIRREKQYWKTRYNFRKNMKKW